MKINTIVFNAIIEPIDDGFNIAIAGDDHLITILKIPSSIFSDAKIGFASLQIVASIDDRIPGNGPASIRTPGSSARKSHHQNVAVLIGVNPVRLIPGNLEALPRLVTSSEDNQMTADRNQMIADLVPMTAESLQMIVDLVPMTAESLQMIVDLVPMTAEGL